ncbi:hypothetical protein EJD97_013726 [Solanum chilense]|uniref:Uncharacterized protein n=1 Tax=Solanum chilense TaxID=4083 RepID=A0A6N2BAE7_SOLCI|nr:hypothetical protein EJD97_013726 [Solanum chilense]
MRNGEKGFLLRAVAPLCCLLCKRGCDDDNVLRSGLTKLGIEDSPTRILAWQIPGWPATEAHSFACNSGAFAAMAWLPSLCPSKTAVSEPQISEN